MTTEVLENEKKVELPKEEEEQQKKVVSYEEYQKLMATNNRLLEESKAHKRSRQRAEEAKKLAEGKKDEVIQTMQERIASYEQREEEIAIATALQEEAEKRNCPDWDLLYRLSPVDVVYDKENGQVLNVNDFFDACETDPRLKRFFIEKQTIVTDNSTPQISNSNSYKDDPVSYLQEARKQGPQKYQEAVSKLQRAGLFG